ncbi:hypothetical protein [Streptomyces prunicolor]
MTDPATAVPPQHGDCSQPGDPVRAARVIIDALDAEPLPRRLLLGADAVTMTQRAEALRAAETAAWADASRRADYPASAAQVR